MCSGRVLLERGHPLPIDCFSSVGLCLISPINYEIDGTNYRINGTNFIIDAINFFFDGIESVFHGTIMSYPPVCQLLRGGRIAIPSQRAGHPLQG